MATGRARRRQRYVACRATRVRPDDWFQIPKLPLATWSRNGSSEPRSKRSRLASAADDRSPANAAPHQPATWNQPSRVRGGRLVSRERISTGPSRACSIRTSAAYRLGRRASTSQPRRQRRSHRPTGRPAQAPDSQLKTTPLRAEQTCLAFRTRAARYWAGDVFSRQTHRPPEYRRPGPAGPFLVSGGAA
jgi:hypothetical protein